MWMGKKKNWILAGSLSAAFVWNKSISDTLKDIGSIFIGLQPCGNKAKPSVASYRHECSLQSHTYIRLNAGPLLPAPARKPVEAHGG